MSAGSKDAPSLDDIGKPSAAPSAPGRDMGELAAREPPQAPSLGDLGNLPDPMRGTAPLNDQTVRQIGRDLHRQGVTDPDKDHEPGG